MCKSAGVATRPTLAHSDQRLAHPRTVFAERRPGMAAGPSGRASGGVILMKNLYAISKMYFRTLFNLFLSPLPPGGPGMGLDCHLPKEIVGLGRYRPESGGKSNFKFYVDRKYSRD